eukprot:SAG22_NODE_2906_length_2113_cov_5.399206_2_plen_298_part_00
MTSSRCADKACNADLFYHTAGRCSPQAARDSIDFSLNQGVDGPVQGAPRSLNGTYSSRAFSAHAAAVIAAHAAAGGLPAAAAAAAQPAAAPLYLYVAPQNVHLGCGAKKKTEGIQAPCETVRQYPKVAGDSWKVQSAVTTELDYVVGNVTAAAKKDLDWSNTVVTFASDNGGPLDHTTNWPLRGGKHTFWDGGVRVVAFISGGLLPPARRGATFAGLAHSSDWYATFVVGVAGGTLPAHTGGVPPDSVNLWPALLHGTPSPRQSVIHQVENAHFSEGTVAVQLGDLKFMQGTIGDDR